MPNESHPYPDHLYSHARIELAQSIIQKEVRKLFLDVSSEAWVAIDRSISEWSKSPTKYHLEDDESRDLWDIFAAVMESVKLKPNFTTLITAENVEWHRANLLVGDIQMSSPLEQLKKVPNLNLRSDLPFSELMQVMDGNKTVIAEQRELIDQHSTDPVQDRYPIIVKREETGLYKVMDGNRRTLKAVIYGQDEIDAWIATTNGETPTNFWIPLNDMFQLVKVYKSAVDDNNEELQNAIALVLRSRFDVSAVAKQTYENRISNQNEIAKKLFELATEQS